MRSQCETQGQQTQGQLTTSRERSGGAAASFSGASSSALNPGHWRRGPCARRKRLSVHVGSSARQGKGGQHTCGCSLTSTVLPSWERAQPSCLLSSGHLFRLQRSWTGVQKTHPCKRQLFLDEKLLGDWLAAVPHLGAPEHACPPLERSASSRSPACSTTNLSRLCCGATASALTPLLATSLVHRILCFHSSWSPALLGPSSACLLVS